MTPVKPNSLEASTKKKFPKAKKNPKAALLPQGKNKSTKDVVKSYWEEMKRHKE